MEKNKNIQKKQKNTLEKNDLIFQEVKNWSKNKAGKVHKFLRALIPSGAAAPQTLRFLAEGGAKPPQTPPN